MVRIKILTIIVGFILACGGEIEGQLSTVQVGVSVEQSSVDADTAFWVDRNGDNVCDTYYIYPTNVNIRVDVNPRSDLPQGVTPSPTEVELIEIIYNRANTQSPQISPEYRVVSAMVYPEGSITIPVEILSQDQKRNFINNYLVIRTNPSMPIYTYYVTLKVRIREVFSGDAITVERTIFMQVSDFLSEGECP